MPVFIILFLNNYEEKLGILVSVSASFIVTRFMARPPCWCLNLRKTNMADAELSPVIL